MIDKVELKEGCFDPDKWSELKPGQMQKWTRHDKWLIGCPRCGNIIDVSNHKVEVNDNKEVTISPSIGHMPCRLHIFVKQGKIQYLSDL